MIADPNSTATSRLKSKPIVSARAVLRLDFTISRFGASHGSLERTGASAQTANVFNPVFLAYSGAARCVVKGRIYPDPHRGR